LVVEDIVVLFLVAFERNILIIPLMIPTTAASEARLIPPTAPQEREPMAQDEDWDEETPDVDVGDKPVFDATTADEDEN
jgi:hypothetical protein